MFHLKPSRNRIPYEYPNAESEALFQAILELKTSEECEHFFRDLCTLPELRCLCERWHIARLLWDGTPYRSIIKITKSSSTSIARVSHWLQYGNGGFRRILDRLERKKKIGQLHESPQRESVAV